MNSESAAGPRPTAPRMHPLVLIGLACGPFISMVDSSAVNVAIPEIGRDLSASVSTVGWIVGAYLLGIGAFLPAVSWLADRFGERRVYVVSLLAFGITSAACAFAGTIAELIALRVAQGVASAPMIPLALALLFKRAAGSGGGRPRPPMAAGLCFFLAPALGPTVGGLLVEFADWRWIFLINVPLVLVGWAACFALPKDAPAAKTDRRPLDGVGIFLLATGATTVILGSTVITDDALLGWGITLVGAALLLAYVWWQAPLRSPALNLGPVSGLRGAVPVAVSVVASVVLFAVLFLIPIFVMQVQGRSAIVTGLVLLPQGLVMGLCTGIGEKLTASLGLRATVGGGMVVLAASSALMLLVDTGTPSWMIALLLAGRGVALGLTLQPLIMGTLGRAARHEVADVSTLFNVVQRLAGSLGVALFATFYQFRASSPGAAASAAPFHETVYLMTGLALLGALLALFLGGRSKQPQPADEPASHVHAHAEEEDVRVAPVTPPGAWKVPPLPPGPGPIYREPAPAIPFGAVPKPDSVHSCPNCQHPITIASVVLPSSSDITTVTTGPQRLPVAAGDPRWS